MKVNDQIKCVGNIEIDVEYNNGKPSEKICFPNTLLDTGKNALAAGVANEIGDSFQFYISNMLFGDGGSTAGNVPLVVNSSRTGLIGTTLANKSVISNVNQNALSQVTFTSVLTFSEANGNKVNEMALQMANGDLYSMSTFAGINKTSEMQLTFTWQLNYI